MDQGLFAASNFALNILLARWLSPQDYGAFSVAYAVFLLFSTFHMSLLSDPLSVFGPRKYENRIGRYLNVLLQGHLILTAVIGLILGLIGLVSLTRQGNSLSPALFGVALASPFILLQWLMRRACYALLIPRMAASAGALYMGFMLIGTYVLFHYGWLSATTALGVIAAASLVSGGWLMVRLKVSFVSRDRTLARTVLKDHWRYGRWVAGTALSNWISSSVYYLLFPFWGGLEAAGAFRALTNLFQPAIHFNTALGTVLLPLLAHIKEAQRFTSVVRYALLLLPLGAATYGVLVAAFGEPLTEFLYGGQYENLASVMWLFGAIPVVLGVAIVVANALNALELPNKVFVAYMYSMATSLTLGLLLMFYLGTTGAILGWLAAYVVAAGVMLRLYARAGDVRNADNTTNADNTFDERGNVDVE